VLDRSTVNNTICVTLPGDPRGKGRHRSRIVVARDKRQFIHNYPDTETKKYEERLRYAALLAMSGHAMLSGALEVWVVARFAVPASWSNKRREQALSGAIRPTGKPDYDNIAKVATDSFSGIIYADDAQVVECTISKIYSRDPSLTVTVCPVALAASDLFEGSGTPTKQLRKD
jgi:Holliday junction resolvase RusA-like endonuclease